MQYRPGLIDGFLAKTGLERRRVRRMAARSLLAISAASRSTRSEGISPLSIFGKLLKSSAVTSEHRPGT